MANVDTRSKQKGRVSPSLINYYKRVDEGLCESVQSCAAENGYIETPMYPAEAVFRPIDGDEGGHRNEGESQRKVDVGLDDELAELVSGAVPDSDDDGRLSPSILNAPPPRRPVARALAQPHRAGSTRRGHMTTASCKRASRMARPSEPSTELLDRGFETIVEKERQLTREGWTRVQGDPDEERWRLDHGLDAAPTGKGSAVPAALCATRGSGASQHTAAQCRVNHIASVKSKTVDTGAHEPAWLINMSAPCGQMYGRLAATAIKSNAVNSSVTKREKTQGAANQTSRINCKIISQAAAAQVDAVAIALARARALARHFCPRTGEDPGSQQLEYTVANPMATNAADASMLWKVTPDRIHTDEAFVVTMSSKLLFNANPSKIGKASVMEVARQLAHAELDDCAISERMGGFNHMLEGVCLAIVNPSEYEIDPVWASWVLIVYMTCHPEGRKLLSATNLTDVDYQTASTFESYGRAEVTRRARLEASQTSGRKRAKRCEPQAPPSVSPGMPEMQGLSLQEQPGTGPSGTPSSTWSSTQATADAADAAEAVVQEEAQVSPLEQMAEEDRKTLATKRKRGAKGCASASTSDSSGMIQWWFAALRGENASVLMSLMAHTTSAAKEAAGQTLHKQADGIAGVAESSVLRGMSEENAVKCVKALAPFAHRRIEEIPTVVAWHWKGKQYRGVVRTRNEASSTTCHACHFASGVVQPPERTAMRVVWSVASMQFTPSDEYRMAVPSIMEQLQSIQWLKAAGKRGEVRAERISETVKMQTQLPRPTAMAGVTRSTISCAIRLAVSKSVADAGSAVAEEIVSLFGTESHGEQPMDFHDAVEDAPTDSLAKVLRVSRHAEGRPEPLCAPATRLALGIVMNEELRSWMAGKTRKNDPCKVVLGHISSCGDVPAIIDAEPPPLLTIVDYQLEQTEISDSPGIGGQSDDTQFGLALHVCGDGAVRVPEMLVALYHETMLSTPGFASAEKKAEFVSMARATVWAASSQASYISNVGPVISAGFANTAISSSKKIAVADNHRLPLLSAFDAYASGLANLEPSHTGTQYAGTYGCPLDHGISAPGHMAHNYRSDKRQHGNMCLSEDMADRLAPRFVDSHWVPIPGPEKRFCEAPVTTRGVPHNLMPGIHACLDEYVEALETLRTHTGREDSATVDSLLVLPFSPWSQALAPTVETTADLSMRLCVRDPASLSVSTGQAYLPDCTHPAKAIVQEPLFRRPCQASLSDNPFATSYEYMDSFFNLANAIVLMGRVSMMEHPSDRQEPLWIALARRVDAWINSPSDAGLLGSAAVCADVLLMLSMMYPLSYSVGDGIVLSPWAAAVPAVQRKLARGERTGLGLRSLGLSEALVEQGRAWWVAFYREGNGVWARGIGQQARGPLGVLLDLLDHQDGSHDVTLERYAEVRAALNDSVRAAWLVASPDGVQPPPDGHPASRARAPEKVRGPMVDPVFVGDENRGVEQRGCLVGLKPHQMRQVCALAMGAHLEGVICNVKRNEGGLSLRVSSAADILDEKGNERSSKSISPVQTEADEQAFGCRADKLRGCKLQRSAWDGNAELLTPLFTAIRAPLPRERLTRGAPRGASYMQQRAAALRKRDQMKTITEEVEAQKLFEEAVVSGVARASREALAHGAGS